ncbi:MAG: M20/M25/M40 family metallo-hydrolase [Novosphingobium sp.]|uniref:M20/M25/M40 family metallo-hydrolase n=1 Tax=Novosphingobium sp. TaxID=1874826 RepID=UPI0030173F26
MIRSFLGAAAMLGVLAGQARAAEPAPRADQLLFRELFRELVETDTSVATGSCTALAEKIALRFQAAGFAEAQITLFKDEAFPLDGGLVVTVPGTSRKAKPMLLLGHIDVVNARREDWVRDPFQFIEEGGYFYGRGTSDMKMLDAIWIDTLIRMKADGVKPKRTIKLALTCGEESGARMNGAQWLAEHRPDLIAAEFALNEGGRGETDGHGKVLSQSMQIGEKSYRNFELQTTNPGGHSSVPVDDNAIYEMADALQRVRALKFPVRFNDTTRRYFAVVGAARRDALGAAMAQLAADPADKAAEMAVSADRTLNAMLRTTCVATLLEAGHASNALPQRAKATINCRIVPGEDEDTTRAALVSAIGDAKVSVTRTGRVRPLAVPPPLDPRIMGPAEKLAARYYPGVPLVPAMMTWATDATYLGPLGIPTYGAPGQLFDPDGNGLHGLDERQSVQSVYVARDYLYDLAKVYAAQE